MGAEAGSKAPDPKDNLLKNDMRFNSSFGAAKTLFLNRENVGQMIEETGGWAAGAAALLIVFDCSTLVVIPWFGPLS